MSRTKRMYNLVKNRYIFRQFWMSECMYLNNDFISNEIFEIQNNNPKWKQVKIEFFRHTKRHNKRIFIDWISFECTQDYHALKQSQLQMRLKEEQLHMF